MFYLFIHLEWNILSIFYCFLECPFPFFEHTTHFFHLSYCCIQFGFQLQVFLLNFLCLVVAKCWVHSECSFDFILTIRTAFSGKNSMQIIVFNCFWNCLNLENSENVQNYTYSIPQANKHGEWKMWPHLVAINSSFIFPHKLSKQIEQMMSHMFLKIFSSNKINSLRTTTSCNSLRTTTSCSRT